MALSYQTTQGTLYIPGAYATIAVQAGQAGLATNGIVTLVGEADGGPDFTLEPDLSANSYGPDQLNSVVAKYGSGQLVDAFRAASSPANDPNITGAPGAFVLVKTNPSGKASGALLKAGGGAYGVSIFDKSWGILGNTIYYTVSAATQETVPTTGTFTYIPAVAAPNISVRVNGGAVAALTVTANQTPLSLATALNGLAGCAATGGTTRATAQSSVGTLAVGSIAGNSAVITYSGTFTVIPSVGDTLVIPTGSVIAGAGNANVGAFVITAATANTMSVTKLSDAGKAGAVAGTITAPLTVGAAAVSATVANDLVDYAPITLTLSGAANPATSATNVGTILDGVGKTLEVNSLTTGTDLFTRCAYVLGTTTPVTWLSLAATPALLVSAQEYGASLNTNQQSTAVQEQLVAGGKIALRLGYNGTTATVTVTATTLTTSVTGGSGANLNISFGAGQYKTLADLAAFINAQTGYQCAVGTASMGQVSPLLLDEVVAANCCTTFGNFTARIKADATSFLNVVQTSSLVQLGNPAIGASFTSAPRGLPDVNTTTLFMSGGSRGGTTDAVYNAAMDAMQSVQTNFLVPLFAQDATVDIAAGLTDSTSSYTVANVQQYGLKHTLLVSTLKRRKNRQIFLAQRDTFANAQNAAANLASPRATLCFQDVKVTGANGIVQSQPWMLAALAAGMQAAGFYRAIVAKGIQCSGVLQGFNTPPDFRDATDTQLETALIGGLLVAKKNQSGGFTWVSDQTTYMRDNNFVYNSIQAVYAADIIALTTAQRMEKAFVGQSVADVGGGVMLAALESIMADFLRLKLIAPSDDAPKGFKNASVRISGTTAVVNVEIKLAGALYFIPINFLISQVQQTAGA